MIKQIADLLSSRLYTKEIKMKMNVKTKTEEWKELLLIMVTEEEKSRCRGRQQKRCDVSVHGKEKEEGRRSDEEVEEE
jgi:hypothetical protein